MASEYNKYMLQISRGLLLLSIYEVVGIVIYYLYRSFKLYKAKELSIKKNKKLLILDNIYDLNKLVNIPTNSHVVVFDNILEYIDINKDEELRNEVDRISNGDVRHIYKPFFLLSSYILTKRVFIIAERTNERYIELNTYLSKLMMILIFIIIFILIGNYTPLKNYINNIIKYMSTKKTKLYLDYEKLSEKVNNNNIFKKFKSKIDTTSKKFDILTTENSSINNMDNKVMSEVRNNLNKVNDRLMSEINNTTEYMNKNINKIRNNLNNNIDDTSNILKNNINNYSNKLSDNIKMMRRK